MKPAKHLFILALIAAAALFVGRAYRIARAKNAEPGPPSAIEQQKGERPSSSPSKRTAPSQISVLAAKLEHDLSMSAGVTRWLHWLEALERSKPTDFADMWRMSEKTPDIRNLLATRWSENYPREFFDFLVSLSRNGKSAPWEALSSLFNAWAKSDVKGLIAALENAPQFPSRNNWRQQAATDAIFDNDVESGLRLMSEWHIENHIPRMKSVAKWAAQDPLHAALYALKHPSGFVTHEVFKEIGREWAKTDPAAALAFAESSGGQFRGSMTESILSQWTEQWDPLESTCRHASLSIL